jgi:hypothetical protein
MMTNNAKFMAHSVSHSGGWLPMMPLTKAVVPGDFGQLRGGSLAALGNILDLSLVQPVDANEPLALADDWCWSSGVIPQYRGSGNETQSSDGGANDRGWQKQALGFDGPGSFAFHGRAPQGQWLLNWAEFAPDITLKLTQSVFTFREVVVVTAVAEVSQWGLAIAGGADAELVVTSEDSSDWGGLSHQSAQLAQSRGLTQAVLGCEQGGYFFKAKKLVLSAQKHDQLMQQLLQQANPPTEAQLSHWLLGGLINRVQANELNLNTCLDIFDWADVTLADLHL